VHLYAFDDNDYRYQDPRCAQAGYVASEERLVALASDVGYSFAYVYDFGDYWTHTITLEEIREAGDVDLAEVIDGAGACPPEDCGGPQRYMDLVNALEDRRHRNHADAVERLGRGYDPATFQPALFEV